MGEKVAQADSLSPFLDLGRPSLNALTLCAHRDVELDLLHAFGIFHKLVVAHATRVCSTLGWKIKHRRKKIRDPVRFLDREVILLPQHVGQSPVSKSVDIAQLALPVEDLL